MSAYKRQQARWAQGSLTCARLLLPQLWRSRLPIGCKLQGTVHLLSYLVSPTMMLIVVAYTLGILLLPREVWSNLPFITYAGAVNPFTFTPLVYLIASQLLLRRSWRMLPYTLAFQVVSGGLAMTIAQAAIKGLLGKHGEFLRTPKWGSQAPNSGAYQLHADLSIAREVLWGAFCLLTAVVAAKHEHWFFVAYGLMLCAGSWIVAFWTVLPDWQAAIKRQHAT